jgi:hypothetical protein
MLSCNGGMVNPFYFVDELLVIAYPDSARYVTAATIAESFSDEADELSV